MILRVLKIRRKSCQCEVLDTEIKGACEISHLYHSTHKPGCATNNSTYNKTVGGSSVEKLGCEKISQIEANNKNEVPLHIFRRL